MHNPSPTLMVTNDSHLATEAYHGLHAEEAVAYPACLGSAARSAESSYGVLMERFVAAVEEDYADTDFLVRSPCMGLTAPLLEHMSIRGLC